MRKLLWLGSLLLPLIAHAEGGGEPSKIYRWVDKSGGIHFSSSPPPAGLKGEELKLHQPNVIDTEASRQQLQQLDQAVNNRLEAAQKKREDLIQRIEETQNKLTKAQETYDKGEAPLPGERRHLAGGGSRLTQEYLQRREMEKKNVQDLERQIEELYNQLNMLR